MPPKRSKAFSGAGRVLGTGAAVNEQKESSCSLASRSPLLTVQKAKKDWAPGRAFEDVDTDEDEDEDMEGDQLSDGDEEVIQADGAISVVKGKAKSVQTGEEQKQYEDSILTDAAWEVQRRKRKDRFKNNIRKTIANSSQPNQTHLDASDVSNAYESTGASAKTDVVECELGLFSKKGKLLKTKIANSNVDPDALRRGYSDTCGCAICIKRKANDDFNVARVKKMEERDQKRSDRLRKREQQKKQYATFAPPSG